MTEYNLPFTTQHVEDVIFIGKKKMITLEYIFYDGSVNDQGQTKYTKLKKCHKREYVDENLEN